MKKFEEYNIDHDILKAINKLGFNQPTEVQTELFPILFDHKDAIVRSQTGSGKTAAFGIPIIQMIEWDHLAPQVLVLTPTRELALQIKDDLFHIGRYKRIKVEAIFGKMSFEGQAKQLKQRTHIVVGTPGRIMDHLERGTIDLSEIKYLVIDEADEMFSMGFEEQMEAILMQLTSNHTTTLLSATITQDIERLCNKFMKSPSYIEVQSEVDISNFIEQGYYDVEDKMDALYRVMVAENPDSCIIFCNTQLEVNSVYETVFKEQRLGKKLHGGMEQKDRVKVINDFKHGYFRYLVATDVAARGLDIDKVELIINYDVPTDPETYVHRIGRTGRINNYGKAITFVDVESKRFFKLIQEQQGNDLKRLELSNQATFENQEIAFLNTIQTRKPIKQEKSAVFKDEITKLHINAGKKTKMRAGDIVGAICSIEGVTMNDIGVISIVDVSTFVEILNNKGELVHKALQKKPIKGRLRKVSKANQSTYEIDYENQEK